MADPPHNPRSLASERRRARRHPASRLPKVHASILAGPDVEILDVSPHGLLVESDVRLTPGAGICLTIKFDNESHMLGGRVARVDTAIADNRLKYRAGIALDGAFAPFDLPTPRAATVDEPKTPSASVPPRDQGAPDHPAAPSPELNDSEFDGLRQALEEQRRNQEHGLRVIDMLKAALRASERARKDVDEARRQERDSWQQERHTFEQAIELAARHKAKLSTELTAISEREQALLKQLEEERGEAVTARASLQSQLDAQNTRREDTLRELDAQRERERLVERALEEERGMLAGLLQEKDRLLAELDGLRGKIDAISKDCERAQDDRDRSAVDQERLTRQLEVTERWCADQHELIYEIWQQTQRSTSLIEGWRASQMSPPPLADENSSPSQAPAPPPAIAAGPSDADGVNPASAAVALHDSSSHA